jgi:adenine-specific DNA-methyltransferase
LTLLQCELNVHSLGGGVMIMVPREAGSIRLPQNIQADGPHLKQIDLLLRAGKLKEAYHEGDQQVLMKQLQLTHNEIALIEQGIATLRHWRTAGRSSRLST